MPKSSEDMIIKEEEILYNKTKKQLTEQILTSVKEMKKRGYLGEKEISFLK